MHGQPRRPPALSATAAGERTATAGGPGATTQRACTQHLDPADAGEVLDGRGHHVSIQTSALGHLACGQRT